MAGVAHPPAVIELAGAVILMALERGGEGGANGGAAGGFVELAEAEADDLEGLDARELLGGFFGEVGRELVDALDVGNGAPRVVDDPLGGVALEKGEGAEQHDAADARLDGGVEGDVGAAGGAIEQVELGFPAVSVRLWLWDGEHEGVDAREGVLDGGWVAQVAAERDGFVLGGEGSGAEN